MKLTQWYPDPEYQQTLITAIENLLEQPAYREIRPCPGCEKACPCSQSTTCTCLCTADCPHAPYVMSSDPERYPIEEKIVALVFGLNCLRVCPPYWSCEGHRFKNGMIARVPQVWFYSRSLIYPKLISEYVFDLEFKNRIIFPWHISMAYAGNILETGFSIEPNIKDIDKPDLELMQNDARIIADNIFDGIRSLAQKYLDQYKQR